MDSTALQQRVEDAHARSTPRAEVDARGAAREQNVDARGLSREQNEAPRGESSPRWLRLVQGTSLQPVWMLRGSASDAGASLGSDPSCAWQIHAPEMPPLACWLRVLADTLFVRAAGACEVSVDGHSLGSMWTPVAQGARLRVADALIEVGLFGRSRVAQSERLRRGLERVPDMPAVPRAPDIERQAQLHAAWFLPQPDASAGLSTLAREGWSATIFGPDEGAVVDELSGVQRVAGLRRFPVATFWITGGLLACAYGCWVLLLDHLHL